MKEDYPYDVFISHVFEDKAAISDALNRALGEAGFRTWYSGADFSVGDSIEQVIHRVIPQCRYAVAIISPGYLKASWTRRELHAFASLETKDRKIILPIWHQVTQELVRNELPFQQDRLALSTALGMDVLLPKLIAEIRKPVQFDESHRKRSSASNSGVTIGGGRVTIHANRITGTENNM